MTQPKPTSTPTIERAATSEAVIETSTEPAIETHDLRKSYGKTVALDGLTMRVERGEVFGFLGPNGAGKTTAVKVLLGLAAPTSGTARLLGSPIGDRLTRRRVGYLPELFRYQQWLKASEVLALHCELAGIEQGHWPSQIETALRIVDLSERSGDRVGTFSKGMQQRLGLAAALLGPPDLVLLDEPTSALDPIGRHDVRQIVRDLRSQGVTVFLNSHLLTEVERVCDRVAIVDRGQVVASGTLDSLLTAPSVRVRVSGLSSSDRTGLDGFGPMEFDGDWLTVRSIDPDSVPDLVSALVRSGGRVHSVDPGRETLEERFIELLSGAPRA